MTAPLPDELTTRCAKAVLRRLTGSAYDDSVVPEWGDLEDARAVLAASGHAELVAALKAARPWIEAMKADTAAGGDDPSGCDVALAQIDAALAKAGETL